MTIHNNSTQESKANYMTNGKQYTNSSLITRK